MSLAYPKFKPKHSLLSNPILLIALPQLIHSDRAISSCPDNYSVNSDGCTVVKVPRYEGRMFGGILWN
jgi:hypothetical protein